MSDLYKIIYDIVKKIPEGSVASYGQIAALSGNPRRGRVVGFAMASCKDPTVPCHRVIYSDGRLSSSFGLMGSSRQRELLILEGVEVFDNNSVDLKKYSWNSESLHG